MPFEVAFDAPAAVRSALAGLGRTEDVRFSPSGRRLALVGYALERIALVDVELASRGSIAQITLAGIRLLESPALREPHGVDFVDEETIVVANRGGDVVVMRLPDRDGDQPRVLASGAVRADDGPGSIAVRRPGRGEFELLVCNNWANTVTRHVLRRDHEFGEANVAVRAWLDLPDGLALSREGRWLAVSNHNTHSVLVYGYPPTRENDEPVGVLRGVRYPHGLRFTADDRYLVAADAAAPYVYAFVRPSGRWGGVGYPVAAIRVMDDDTFARGRHNPQEGGPKGIDLEPRTGLLAVTAECVPLAFFDLHPALDAGLDDGSVEALVRYELDHLAERRELTQAVSEASALLRAFQQTKAWRLTQPARAAYGVVRRIKPRA